MKGYEYWLKYVEWKGGYSNYFWRGVGPKVWHPYPFLKIFCPKKNGWFDFFNFCKWGPISRVFVPKKWLHFFAILVECDPLLRIFLTKMRSSCKDFWWKTNPFRQHISVCHIMRVPPGENDCEYLKSCIKWKRSWKKEEPQMHVFDWRVNCLLSCVVAIQMRLTASKVYITGQIEQGFYNEIMTCKSLKRISKDRRKKDIIGLYLSLKAHSLRGRSQKKQNSNFSIYLLLSSKKYISPEEISRNHFRMKLVPF